MTAHVLKSLGEEPTALVGGELNDIGSNVAFGRPDVVVAEADESDRSLLYLHPEAAIVTNVEFDHPDFYASLEEVLETFTQFIESLPESGHLVVCADDPLCLELAGKAPCRVTTYGISGGDLRAEVQSPNSYKLFENGVERGLVETGVYGRHNILNSLAAVGIARWFGHDAFEAAGSLKNFVGVRRRFQLKGEKAGVKVVDDYAHHPTELAATLDAARSTSDGRVIAVFQPHRYSRTRKLYREFGEAFDSADAVLITDVYGAGEMPQPGVNGKLIVDALCESDRRSDIYYIPELGDIPEVLNSISKPEDTVLTMGAGDITRAGDEFLALMESEGAVIKLLRPICLALAVALLTAITVYILSYLAYPVTGLKVENARMLPETEVWDAVPDHASLLTLNSGLLENRIKTNPWVKGVEVSKDWKSGIVSVEVEERSPVLKGEVGGREVVFAGDGSELPKLGGSKLKGVKLSESRLRGILDTIRSVERNGSEVGLISEVDSRGVQAVVNGRRVIFSGELEESQARALPELMEQNPDAPVFDLRSPGRVVVGEASTPQEPRG